MHDEATPLASTGHSVIETIALKYYQTGQVLVQNTPSGKEYVFVVRANISLAYIDAPDVDDLLSRKKVCGGCGGRVSQLFFRANEDDIRRWENGGGR